MADLVMVHCAAGSLDEAERIGGALLDARLAACVQILPLVSCYVWRGERVRDDEQLMIIKSRSELFDQISETIRSLHSYDTPEITAAPISAADPRYRAWLEDATARDKD